MFLLHDLSNLRKNTNLRGLTSEFEKPKAKLKKMLY